MKTRTSGWLAILLLSLTSIAAAQNSLRGSWSAPQTLLVDGVHAALLPNGKVLYLPHRDSPSGLSTSVVFDPANPGGAVYGTTPENHFCGGHTQLADGRVLLVGGETSLGPAGVLKGCSTFSPTTESWTPAASLNRRRWYGSALLHGDGRVWMFGGMQDAGGSVAEPSIEIYDPQANTWTLAGGQDIPGQFEEAYNRLHLLPDGRFFQSGHLPDTWLYDPFARSWTFVARTNLGLPRGDGGSVRLQDGRIMIVGGQDLTTFFASAEIIDLDQANPQWTNLPSMRFPRAFLDTVLLPDGKVFVVGGEDGTPAQDTPELYDPRTNTWTTMARHQVKRPYHSTALLLPDARVICSGGTDNNGPGLYGESAQYEIWSPPYLFRTPRPIITGMPALAGYGEQVSMTFTSQIAASHVVIHKAGSGTHAFNYNQISVPVNLDASTGTTATFTVPNNPHRLPPGQYMVFLMSTDGVPSVARWIDIGGPSLSVPGGIVAGQSTTFRLMGMPPGSSPVLGVSVTGAGPIPVMTACGLVNAELTWPVGILGVLQADARGTANLTIPPLPVSARGATVWLDALEVTSCVSPRGLRAVIR